MSNMLNQAIIDAEALKEAAIKNAEATIVEKYSDDIKKAVDQLLEQEAPPPGDAELMAAMGGMGAPPPQPGTLGAPGGMDAGADILPAVPETYMEGVPREVRIDLAELVQEMKMDDLNPSEKQVHELVAEEVTGGEEIEMEGGEEMFTIQESVLSEILGEDMDMDEDLYEEGEDLEEAEELEEASMTQAEYDALHGKGAAAAAQAKHKKKTGSEYASGATPPPPRGSRAVGPPKPHRDTKIVNIERPEHSEFVSSHGYAPIKRHPMGGAVGASPTRRPGRLEESYRNLYAHFQQANEQNKRFRELLIKTQEKLNEVNVRNAQLHYTNRTLVSDSLNERQKDKIVEAIQKAGTVGEAKVIFETLQSAVAGAGSKQNAPKSLNEAISNRSSAFLPRKREETQTDSTMLNRLQKLAGIK